MKLKAVVTVQYKFQLIFHLRNLLIYLCLKAIVQTYILSTCSKSKAGIRSQLYYILDNLKFFTLKFCFHFFWTKFTSFASYQDK